MDVLTRRIAVAPNLTTVSAKLTLGLPGAASYEIGGEWNANDTERKAAWELYVELATRVALQSLEPPGALAPRERPPGSLRETLSSLHSLFPTTREILRRYGPDVGARNPSVGSIAITVLNKLLRPFLAKWHQKLQDWEACRNAGESTTLHEAAWPDAVAMRGELDALRTRLNAYGDALAKIARVA